MLSLFHLSHPPRARAPNPPLLLLLHGVGSHEADLMGLASYLDPRFHIISARAPFVLAPGAYAWFHIEFSPTGIVIDPAEAEESRVTLLRFIGELVQSYGVDSTRIFLMGFSQGGIISLSLALTEPRKLAGVVAMSARILPEVLPRMAPAAEMNGLPILLMHGVADPVLGIEYGRTARDLLSSLPVALTYREYPMGHQVTEESLGDVASWLRTRLDEPG